MPRSPSEWHSADVLDVDDARATIRVVLLVAALSSILIGGFIVYTVAIEAAKFLTSVDLSDLVAIGWFPRRLFDISTLLLGTLMVTGIAMLLATPVGLASAIYLSEYATPGSSHRQAGHRDPGRHPEHRPGVLRPDIHQPEDRPGHLPRGAGIHDPGGGHRRGILSIPLVATVAEDAMRAVPCSLRKRRTASARAV